MSTADPVKERTATQEMIELMRSEALSISEAGRTRYWDALHAECIRQRSQRKSNATEKGKCAQCHGPITGNQKYCSAECIEDQLEQKRQASEYR